MRECLLYPDTYRRYVFKNCFLNIYLYDFSHLKHF